MKVENTRQLSGSRPGHDASLGEMTKAEKLVTNLNLFFLLPVHSALAGGEKKKKTFKLKT